MLICVKLKSYNANYQTLTRAIAKHMSQSKNLGGAHKLLVVTNRKISQHSPRLKFDETLDDQLHWVDCQPNNTKDVDTDSDEIELERPSVKPARNRRLVERLKRRVGGERWQPAAFSLVLISKGDQQHYLQTLVEQNNGAPWLFFLHGNNQTLHDSLTVCRRLQRYYQVNIILFSWPSRSYNPRSVPYLLATALMMGHPVTRIAARLTAVKSVYNRHAQYKQARKIAEQTQLALATALQRLIDELLAPMQQAGIPVHMLVHSLGHYLLLLLAKSGMPEAAFQFDTTIFHQADIDVDELPQLLSKTSLINEENTYLTYNKKDYALFLSGLWNNRMNPYRAYSRLGNAADKSVNRRYQVIDLTAEPGVGFNHGVLWQRKLSSNVKRQILKILNPGKT